MHWPHGLAMALQWPCTGFPYVTKWRNMVEDPLPRFNHDSQCLTTFRAWWLQFSGLVFMFFACLFCFGNLREPGRRLSLGRSLGRPCPRRHALGMLSLAGSVPAPCERRTYTRKQNPNIFMQWGWELSQQWSSGEFRQIRVCNQKGQKGSTGRLRTVSPWRIKESKPFKTIGLTTFWETLTHPWMAS